MFENIKKFKFINHLISLNTEIYVVGGIVRDSILGKVSKDIDIVVRLIELEDLINELKKFGKVSLCGESFSVIKFEPSEIELSEPIDIALPRADFLREPLKGYHGITAISDPNMDIENDIKRRDLTINSIAYDIINDKLIDPFNGLNDLKNGIIKATSIESFQDDPLRCLRAIQFASRFEFVIENETWKMIIDSSDSIKYISGERYLIELDKMFYKSPNIKYGIQLLVDSLLYENIFGKKYLNKNHKIVSIFDFYYDICRDENVYRNILKGNDKIYKGIKAIKYVIENDIYERRLIFNAIKISETILESALIEKDETVKEFLDSKYPKYITELDINGNDLQELGYKGKEIGNRLSFLLDEVLTNKRINKFENLK